MYNHNPDHKKKKTTDRPVTHFEMFPVQHSQLWSASKNQCAFASGKQCTMIKLYNMDREYNLKSCFKTAVSTLIFLKNYKLILLGKHNIYQFPHKNPIQAFRSYRKRCALKCKIPKQSCWPFIFLFVSFRSNPQWTDDSNQLPSNMIVRFNLLLLAEYSYIQLLQS